jgi:hypothetical protein
MKTYWSTCVILFMSVIIYSFVFEKGIYYFTSMVEIPSFLFYALLFGYNIFVGVFLGSLENNNEKRN